MGEEASQAERRLAELGYRLGKAPAPAARYVRAVTTGNLVFVSGHGPTDAEGRIAMRGQVGGALTLDDGREAARLTVLACLASLKEEIGDLDRVRRIVKLLGFVNCAPGFNDTPAVINGASEILEHMYGERGRHARSAIGTSVLPFDIPVEIEMVVEIA